MTKSESSQGGRLRVAATGGASSADTGQPKKGPEGRLIEQLADLNSIEELALTQMPAAPRVAGEDRFSGIFAEHLTETEEQQRRLRERLEAYGVDPSTAGNPASTVAFAASEADTAGKLAARAYSYQHLELAAYELLRRTADTAGDATTAAFARQTSAEERRMAERLEGCFDTVVEFSLNGGGPEDLSRQLNRCLGEAHAIEREGLHLLETALEVVDDTGLRRFFERHLRESEEHEAMIRERLEVRGEGPAQAKDAALRISGLQLGPLLAAQPDTAAALRGFAYAYENLEIAAYELLGRVAGRAGDEKVRGVATRILAEERGGAAELAGAWSSSAAET